MEDQWNYELDEEFLQDPDTAGMWFWMNHMLERQRGFAIIDVVEDHESLMSDLEDEEDLWEDIHEEDFSALVDDSEAAEEGHPEDGEDSGPWWRLGSTK